MLTVSPIIFQPGNANELLVLVTGQLAEEIKKIGKEIEQLFGILNEDLLKLQ